MDASLQKTLSRVHKLMALAKDGAATEHEAALALEMAQKIMGEANLTMATLEASGQLGGDGSRRVKDGLESRSPYKWHRVLMAQIAELNSVFCEVKFKRLAHTSMFDGYDLIGREANVASTRVMFEYLLQAVERVCKEHLANPSECFGKYANEFKQGCADRLASRLRERHIDNVNRQEREAREAKARAAHPAASQSTAVVVVMRDYYATEADLNNDLKLGREPGTTARLRAEQQARAAEARADKEARRDAIVGANPGINKEVAWYMAHGWAREEAEKILAPKDEKPETEAQKRKREQREQRADDRNYRRWRSENNVKYSDGYRAGSRAGADIGLDEQVDAKAKRQLGI